MNAREEAAYDALADHIEPLEAVDHCCASIALAAADAVMFDDAAVERAAMAVSGDFPWYGNYSPKVVERHVRAVIAALKGDQP